MNPSLRNFFFSNNILLLTLLVGACSSISFNAKEVASGFGAIQGRVNYCSSGGNVGMRVFIPGQQFSAFLGEDGHFMFKNVPAGTYTINYVINDKLVNQNKNVLVTSGGTNELGEIAFCDEQVTVPGGSQADDATTPELTCDENPQREECLDSDKDGVIAAKDCDDNDPDTRPGAVERCDGIDNNCNGEIDEVLTVDITHGVGLCDMGKVSVKSCNKGFDDCDKDPANGCETDIMNDNDNCGACGNQCSDLDICKLGFC
ncbi:MAG: MopE-related protein [Gammaproteobacteria bacterium]|jgi:hypothetical protein